MLHPLPPARPHRLGALTFALVGLGSGGPVWATLDDAATPGERAPRVAMQLHHVHAAVESGSFWQMAQVADTVHAPAAAAGGPAADGAPVRQARQADADQPATPAAGDGAPEPPAPPRRTPQPWAYDELPRPPSAEQPPANRVNFLIGVAANTSPNFFGGKSQNYKIKPVGALEWGRWRLSSGGGYGLMGQGRRDRGRGAQAVLRETDRFNLSLSLSVDRGRDVANTERLKGVPDVRATLRARLRARYNLGQRWTASLAASQDILNRGRGMELDGWLGYRWPISEATRMDVGVGGSWGNSQYMRSQFGIPQASTVASGYPAFKPRGGLYQTEIGVDMAHALSRAWVVFGGVRYSQLHGDARRSPLTLRSRGVSATVGIAWRN